MPTVLEFDWFVARDANKLSKINRLQKLYQVKTVQGCQGLVREFCIKSGKFFILPQIQRKVRELYIFNLSLGLTGIYCCWQGNFFVKKMSTNCLIFVVSRQRINCARSLSSKDVCFILMVGNPEYNSVLTPGPRFSKVPISFRPQS